MKQQFQQGDLVHVAKDLGRTMSHFANDIDAIVIGSYADQYSGNDRNSYTLHIKGRGKSSWYYGEQLTLIERNRIDLLKQWEREKIEEAHRHANLDWIFENGHEVLKRASGATVRSLADCVGVGDLWGSHGEGMAYYENSLRVLHVAKPFLLSKDKAGWLDFSKKFKLSTVDYKIT